VEEATIIYRGEEEEKKRPQKQTNKQTKNR